MNRKNPLFIVKPDSRSRIWFIVRRVDTDAAIVNFDFYLRNDSNLPNSLNDQSCLNENWTKVNGSVIL